MNASPEVSVVMSVYNGADHLAETLDSVLGQQGCALEFIVIDDGSTDASARMLDDYAAHDPRLRVVHQENTGLTRALIRGCALARAEFIARQDAGDVSLPGRLAQQLAFIRSRPDAPMVACGVEVCGPQGEFLQRTFCAGEDLQHGLLQTEISRLRGPPHHGSTLFRHDAYVRVDGYRPAFRVAQDLDLWLRLSEQGPCLGMPEVLYRARLQLGSISSRRRGEQIRMAELALACRRLRHRGDDDRPLLLQSRPQRREAATPGRTERARFHYFVARCLAVHDADAARAYYRRALRDNPLHVKALLHWALG